MPFFVSRIRKLFGSHNQKIFNLADKEYINPKIISGEVEVIDNKDNSIAQVKISIQASSKKSISLDMRLSDNMGASIGFGSLGTLDPNQLVELEYGINNIAFQFSLNKLAVGQYSISLDLTLPDQEYFDRMEKCLDFEVVRPARNKHIRVLNQSWNYGSFEIPLAQTKL